MNSKKTKSKKTKNTPDIFEKAFEFCHVVPVRPGCKMWVVTGDKGRMEFTARGRTLTCQLQLPYYIQDSDIRTFKASESQPPSQGDICQFIHLQMQDLDRGDPPPVSLKGANASGSFEDLFMKEGERLYQRGELNLGRYPVASVMIAGTDRPLQVPSMPDFEGVFTNGQQFIFEAKVCSEASFTMYKDKLKPRQIRHMLKRSQFGVPCYLVIHFNARCGKTFYDPASTWALEVKPASKGGLKIWQAFADSDGEATASLSRATMSSLGATPVRWHTPQQCRYSRPDLFSFLRSRS